VLTSLVTQIKTLSDQSGEQLALHTDGHIFTNLPRSGIVRAARPAEIGDCCARFPDRESLICLAGVAPSTRQFGKHEVVSFRWAVDKQTCATPSAASPPTADAPTLGQPSSTTTPSPAAMTIPRYPHPGPRPALRHLALLAQPG
jgi:hypothetical protein